MVQAARSSKSKSLLREAETLELLIEDNNKKAYFENKIKEVVENRKDVNKRYSGETHVKRELLAYLSQQGEIATANVWCRKLQLHKADELLRNINSRLSSHRIQGVVELHLQDREINSPHIQYVGTDVYIAESLIAAEVIKMKFEDDFQSAASKEALPAYVEATTPVQTISYDVRKEENEKYEKAVERIKEVREKIKDNLSSIREQRDNFLDLLGIKREDTGDFKGDRVRDILGTKTSSVRQQKMERIVNNDTDDLLKQWRERRNNRGVKDE